VLAKVTLGTKYDLVANICHDTRVIVGQSTNAVEVGSATSSNVSSVGNTHGPTKTALENGCYRIHLLNKTTGQWFELQDLHVSETMPQLIGLSESYMLVYERKKAK